MPLTRRGGERGSATVYVVALAALVLAAAADLAALAAASRALEGASAACVVADAIARAQGARLVACELSGDISQVVVEVRPQGRLSALGAARGRARAGPAGGLVP